MVRTLAKFKTSQFISRRYSDAISDSVRSIICSIGLLSLGLTGCSSEMATQKILLSSATDFLKSEIIVSGPALANGTDQILVYIHLMNSDSTPVVGFKPSYSLLGPSQTVKIQCFASDSTGLSICMATATAAGKVAFSVTNIPNVSLANTLTFDLLHNRTSQGQILAGGQQNVSAGRYSVSSGIGNSVSKSTQKAGPYLIYSSVQSSVNSPTGGL